ncbi:Wzz/FepE/Etk N-terminal domain-containing protein [Aeromonas hydrophila]|nr:Wzz/FepE/Etk N-terminal domain-containing protein [Aeromonas hydrophila]
MSEKTPVIPNQWAQAHASDEIDLRELVLVLWRQKVLILLITGAFAVAGIIYAMTARQVWTSQALVSEPSVSQVAALQLAVDKIQTIMSSNGAPPSAGVFSSL